MEIQVKAKDRRTQEAEQLIAQMNSWAQENPKTAVAAVGVGAIATAYCGYKMVKKLLS